MSVRNQYARNYFKVAPLPLSSNQIAIARNAARRRNVYRFPDDNHGEDSAIGAEKKPDQEMENLFLAKKNDKTKKRNEVTMYGKQELNKFAATNPLNKGKHLSMAENRHDEVKNKDIKSNVSSKQITISSSNISQARPMSARPDSRWERRVREDYTAFSDEESDIKAKCDGPMQDKQDSRKQTKSDCEVLEDWSVRPKTSHGRQKSIDSNAERAERKKECRKVEHERPKSRIVNTKERVRSSDGSSDKSLNSKKDSNQRQVNVRNNDTDSAFRDYNIGISTFYPDLVDKIHGTGDINLQIEDIDLDVDPVLFFMQDTNDSHESSVKRRASLSKDAISVISNEKYCSQMIKPAIGFQGNNQSKRHSAPEIIDRFHGNRVSSLQNSIAESNQRYFNNGRQERIKSDSGENVYKIRTNPTNIDKSLYTGAAIKRDSEKGKQCSGNDSGTAQTYNVATNRKPRKLKPITPSYFEE